MKVKITSTEFGSITIEGETYEHDVVIRPDGTVEKRKKKLSKSVYGTSHLISPAEAQHIFREGTERLIIGTGQSDLVRLSDEAAAFLAEKGCRVDPLPTEKAIHAWNQAEGAVTGLFHVTC